MAYSNLETLPKARIKAPQTPPLSIVGEKTSAKSKDGSTLYALFGKRVLDLILVVAALPIILPVLFVVWLITVLDGGSGVYGQIRVGKNGKLFKCYKIRTMVPNAERVLREMIENDDEIAREWRENQKLENDPRITRWGRILRRTSLDELPQLLNVLLGQMSLIGPRPFMPDQKELYDSVGDDPAYYKLRPGVSGLWQVEHRSKGSFCDRHKYDEQYARSLTLINDVRLIFKTLAVIAKRTGK